MDISTLEHRINIATGKAPADLVIRNARSFNLVTGKVEGGDIAIAGDTIVAVGGPFEGTKTLDGHGRIAVPGFIDAHCHIESTLLTPDEYERAVLTRGTTTVIADPHELANVTGQVAIDWLLAVAKKMFMDIRVALPSCVPATHMETSGATLDAADLVPYRNRDGVAGLAEMMNFPGVIGADPGVLAKIAAFYDHHIDGHAPMLCPPGLDAYIACGISTDHECATAEEARSKLARGMNIIIREGSAARDLDALAEIIDITTAQFLAFCTDDRNPLDIAESGHIDHMIRTAISRGADPLAVYRIASLSAARMFGLTDRGLIAPGQRADIVLIDDIGSCLVTQVVAGGVAITPETLAAARALPEAPGRNSIRLDPVTADTFRMSARTEPMPVIGVREGSLLTDRLEAVLPAKDDSLIADPANDRLKVAVLARHGKNRNIGRGIVSGFGLLKGALASSVGHDSHNVIVVGANEADMAAAVNRLIETGGGFVVAEAGKVLAELALPIAGLIGEETLETTCDKIGELKRAARGLGSKLKEPFLQMAFLPLPVIPHLKITDMGLVDVDAFEVIE
ncbi:MAG: adenine deaminase [Pseudomonadota bacterium]|nr:adenine deaminase [Pseudomonadota bacterium]